MNAFEARAKLDEAMKEPTLEEFFDVYIEKAIANRTNLVSVKTPYQKTKYNVKWITDFLEDRGFEIVKIERYLANECGCDEHGHSYGPDIYNLQVSFSF